MEGEGSSMGCFLHLDCLFGENPYYGQFTADYIGKLVLYV